jgi:hypothetical protein
MFTSPLISVFLIWSFLRSLLHSSKVSFLQFQFLLPLSLLLSKFQIHTFPVLLFNDLLIVLHIRLNLFIFIFKSLLFVSVTVYTSCISASRPDHFTPRKRAPGTHFILLQFGLTCPIYCRFRGVFLKANNSGIPPLLVTASERTKKKPPPHCFRCPATASERTPKEITILLFYKGRRIAKKDIDIHISNIPTNIVSLLYIYI